MNKQEIIEQLQTIKAELTQALKDEDYEEAVICEEAISQLENELSEEN